jgi:hypothetical protein
MTQVLEGERIGRRRGSGRKLVAVTAVALLLIVLVALMAWWHSTNVTPAVTVPTPAMPSPNAFDSLVAAGNAAVEDDAIGQAINPPPAPVLNGPGSAPLPAGGGNAPGSMPPPAGRARAYSPAEEDSLVRKNAEALRLLREGLAHEYMNPPARSFTQLFPHYSRFRALARLLRLEAQVKEARGDRAGAMDSNLDALALGVRTPRGGVLIGELVGIAIQAIGRRDAWEQVDHLGAGEAARAARRMERLLDEQVPFWQTLQEEKWAMQAGLLELFAKPDWRGQLLNLQPTGPNTGGPPSPEQLSARARMLLTSKAGIMNSYTSYMDRYIASARGAYPARGAAPAPPNDVVGTALVPVFDQSQFAITKAEALNSLLTTSLALRAYRVEHGRYPDTLSRLAPKYLKKIPADPFALKGGVGYRRTADRVVVYSVGPDGVNDGGRPVDDPAKNTRRHAVDSSSLGDIVAGINIQ